MGIPDEVDPPEPRDQTDVPVAEPASTEVSSGADDLMARTSDLSADASSASVREKQVCPFCGSLNDRPDAVDESSPSPCPKCAIADTPATRQATKARIGPWFLRQNRNPAAPGMKFETLLSLLKRGQLTPQSIVRGPTTHQLWRFAVNVKGLSREFELCYHCGASIDRNAGACGQCGRNQDAPANPDLLVEPVAASVHVPIQRESRPPTPMPTGRSRTPAAEESALAKQPRREADEILSPEELAAAFQLDFNPYVARRFSRGWFIRLAAALLLIAIGGGILGLAINPTWRDATMRWTQQRYARIRDSITRQAPQKVPSPTDDALAALRELDEFAEPTTVPSQLPIPVDPRPANELALDTHLLKEFDEEVSARAPANDIAEPDLPLAPLATPNYINPPPPRPISSAELDTAREKSRQLWREAHDAEAQRDYAQAVRLYEEMQKLPRDAWFAGLEIKLERARQLAAARQ